MDALRIARASSARRARCYRRPPRVSASLAVLLALLVLPPAARAAEPGLNAELTYGISRADIDHEIRLLEAAHVSWVRMSVGWDGVEPTARGRRDRSLLGDFDHAASRLRRAGIGVIMPVADGVPFWASGDPHKRTVHGAHRWNVHYRPWRFAEYARFFSWVVRRYARLGVHVYEVWNEPNIPRFWPSGPNAGAYTGMLRAAYPAIKRADPSSTVVLGGLSQNDHAFLRAVYAHGGGRFFDAVGDHVYPDGDPAHCGDDASGARSRASLCGVQEIHTVMERAGDGQKPVWLTELGWSTTSSARGVSEMRQASYLRTALERLASAYPWVKAALVYQLRNVPFLHDRPEDWEANLGLVRTNFSAKPAYRALADYATTRWMLGGRAGSIAAALP